MLTGSYNVKLNSGGWIRFPRKLRCEILTDWLIDGFDLIGYKDGDMALFTLAKPVEGSTYPDVIEVIAGSGDCEIQPSKTEAERMIRHGFDKDNPPPVKLRIPIGIRRRHLLKPGEELVIIGVDSYIEVWRASDLVKDFQMDE